MGFLFVFGKAQGALPCFTDNILFAIYVAATHYELAVA